MTKRSKITEGTWTDPDDAPILTKEWFEQADRYEGTTLVRRGRPKSDNPKQPISLRLDADVIDAFRNSGPGWQSRINAVLRKAVGI